MWNGDTAKDDAAAKSQRDARGEVSTPSESHPGLTASQKVDVTDLNPLLTSPDLRGRKKKRACLQRFLPQEGHACVAAVRGDSEGVDTSLPASRRPFCDGIKRNWGWHPILVTTRVVSMARIRVFESNRDNERTIGRSCSCRTFFVLSWLLCVFVFHYLLQSPYFQLLSSRGCHFHCSGTHCFITLDTPRPSPYSFAMAQRLNIVPLRPILDVGVVVRQGNRAAAGSH